MPAADPASTPADPSAAAAAQAPAADSESSPAPPAPAPAPPVPSDRFPEDEEARLLAAAHQHKASGNTLFTTRHYLAAIDAYQLALTTVPSYLAHETAILHSNIAACYLRPEVADYAHALEHAQEAVRGRPGWGKALMRRVRAREGVASWKELEIAEVEIEAALAAEVAVPENVQEKEKKEKGVEEVETIEGDKGEGDKGEGDKGEGDKGEGDKGEVVTNEGEVVTNEGEGVIWLEQPLTTAERREFEQARTRVKAATADVKQREIATAMSGLKELGNGLLKPFGLSTDNFGCVKDEKTGGYSMQFKRGPTE